MGIYTNGTIFGIKIYNFNDDDFANILLEKKYDEIMSNEQMSEAYLFYTKLNNKNEIHFVQGKYNMGGRGAIVFCGKKGYQLIGWKKRRN
jgi:hypothetical protein